MPTPSTIPVSTVEEMEDLLDQGIASQDDYEEFIDAYLGYGPPWPGFIYPNKVQLAAADAHANAFHANHDQTSHGNRAGAGSNPKLDRWEPENPNQAKALQRLKDIPSLGRTNVDGEMVKDAIKGSAPADPAFRTASGYTDSQIESAPKTRETVPTDDIIATKTVLKRSAIAAVIHALDNPQGPWFRPGYLPIAIKTDMGLYLWDGHHRLEGARILNHPTIEVEVIDQSQLTASAYVEYLRTRRIEEFHGSHDQQSHGNWATGVRTNQDLMAPSGAVSSWPRKAGVKSAVKLAFRSIGKVHSVPDNIEQIPIRTAKATANFQAAYSYQQTSYAPTGEQPVMIEVNPAKTQHPELSFTHEYGHYLDSQVFNRLYAPEGRAVVEAISKSNAYSALNQIAERAGDPNARGKAKYYLTPVESFARAYAQWIATRSNDATMQNQVKQIGSYRGRSEALNAYASSQWLPSDFEPIALAMDELFRSKGLLK